MIKFNWQVANSMLVLLSVISTGPVGCSNDFPMRHQPNLQDVKLAHILTKRTEAYTPPQFDMPFYLVDEGGGIVDGEMETILTICVLGGQYHERREFAVFTASGPEDRCFGQSCPPATVGMDYADFGTQTFFLSPGERRCFELTIFDDDEIEGLEFFLIVLEDLRWGEILTTVSVTISDNDSPTFATASSVYSEDVGVIPVCVNGANISMPVILQTLNNTNATVGEDYEELYSEFVLEAGEQICVDVAIIDDNEYEGNYEVINLLFSNGDGTNGSFSYERTLFILDNDLTPVFELAQYTVTEGDEEVEVCIRFDGDPSTVVESMVQTVEGSAKEGTDFNQFSDSILLRGGQRVCRTITIIDNNVAESTSFFTLTMTSSNSAVMRPFSTAVVILDDDFLNFQESMYVVNEADGTVRVCVNVTSGDENTEVNATIFTFENTAREYKDFLPAVVSVTVRGIFCVYIRVLTDRVREFDEQFYVIVYSRDPVNNRVVDTRITTVIIEDTNNETCEALSPPENGMITFTDGNRTGSIATYQCNLGYRLVGLNGGRTRACNLYLRWSGDDPTCEEIICSQLEDPEKGTVVLSGRTVGSTAIYSCNTGYMLQGNSRRVCDALNGDWTGAEPSCILIQCPKLPIPDNGEVRVLSRTTDSGIALYACSPGFDLIGGNTRTCNPDGQWSGTEPQCQQVLCSELEDPQNGTVRVSGQTVGSYALYSCDTDYMLQGNSQRVCDPSNVDWTGEEPSCILIRCPQLLSPDNGIVRVLSRAIDSGVALYSCAPGFVLIGDNTTTCNADGQWSGTEPQCRPEGEALGVELVNDSPKIEGNTVSVDFVVTGIPDTVVCRLGNEVIEENFQSRSFGSMKFTDVDAGVYTLEITAIQKDNRVAVSSFFEMSDHPDFCGVHLINKGLTVNGDSIYIEFAGIPSANSYRCKLDDKSGFDCNELIEMDGIEPGEHRLKIMHDRAECGPRRKLFLHFQI